MKSSLVRSQGSPLSYSARPITVFVKMPEVLIKVGNEIEVSFQFFDFVRNIYTVSIIDTNVIHDISEGPNIIEDQPRRFLKLVLFVVFLRYYG